MNDKQRQNNFNNLERSAKTAAIASIFNMSQDRRHTSGNTGGSLRVKDNVAVHHQAFTNELTPQSGSKRRSLRIEDISSQTTPIREQVHSPSTRVPSPYVSALRAQSSMDSTIRHTPSQLDHDDVDDIPEQQEAEASSDMWRAFIHSREQQGESTDDQLLSSIQEVRTRLGEDLRRDYDERRDYNEEAQGPYNGYDDEDDEAYGRAPSYSQSKLEESIEAISEQLRLMNQRQDRTERETANLAERQDRLELTTQQSLEATRDLIKETRREAAENTDRAISRITEEVAKAIAAAQASTQQSIRDVADQCQRQTELVRVELRGEIRAMYEHLHEEVQTVHESTESFKLHTWETTTELRHLIQGVVDRNANVLLEDSASAATQLQYTPSTDADQVPVDVSPITPALTLTQDTYAQKILSEDEAETNISLLRPTVIQLLDYLRQGYQKASSKLAPQHSFIIGDSVEFMDELVSASANFTNCEFLEVADNRIARNSRRTAAMKLFAKHLADRRPEMLHSLPRFVDAHEAIIGYLDGDHFDHTMRRLIPKQQAQTYVEAWEAPFHFIQQAVRERTRMLSLSLVAISEQVSFNLLAMARTPYQQQPWSWDTPGRTPSTGTQSSIISTTMSRTFDQPRSNGSVECTPTAPETVDMTSGDESNEDRVSDTGIRVIGWSMQKWNATDKNKLPPITQEDRVILKACKENPESTIYPPPVYVNIMREFGETHLRVQSSGMRPGHAGLGVFNCSENVIRKDEVIGIYSGILSRALDQEDRKPHSKYALRLDTRLYVEADPDIIDKMAGKGDITRATAETLGGAYTTRINMLLTPKARHNVKFIDSGLGLLKAIADITPGEELSVDYGPEHDWSRERGELMECCASICWRAYEQAAEHYAEVRGKDQLYDNAIVSATIVKGARHLCTLVRKGRARIASLGDSDEVLQANEDILRDAADTWVRQSDKDIPEEDTSKFGRLVYDAYLAFEEANDGGYSRFQHSLEHGKQRKPSEITGAPYFGLWNVPYQVLYSDHIRKQFVFGESDMSILESEANQAVEDNVAGNLLAMMTTSPIRQHPTPYVWDKHCTLGEKVRELRRKESENEDVKDTKPRKSKRPKQPTNRYGTYITEETSLLWAQGQGSRYNDQNDSSDDEVDVQDEVSVEPIHVKTVTSRDRSARASEIDALVALRRTPSRLAETNWRYQQVNDIYAFAYEDLYVRTRATLNLVGVPIFSSTCSVVDFLNGVNRSFAILRASYKQFGSFIMNCQHSDDSGREWMERYKRDEVVKRKHPLAFRDQSYFRDADDRESLEWILSIYDFLLTYMRRPTDVSRVRAELQSMVFTPLVAEYFPDFYYRMKRLHQQIGGDTQASEGERLWDYVQKSLYSNRGGGQQFFDRLYAQLHILARDYNQPSTAVESEKFLDTHLREACRKLEIAFPVPLAQDDKQQRPRRTVLAHAALCDEGGSTSSLSTESISTPSRPQAMVSVSPAITSIPQSFVDEVFESDAQAMFQDALYQGYTCYRATRIPPSVRVFAARWEPVSIPLPPEIAHFPISCQPATIKEVILSQEAMNYEIICSLCGFRGHHIDTCIPRTTDDKLSLHFMAQQCNPNLDKDARENGRVKRRLLAARNLGALQGATDHQMDCIWHTIKNIALTIPNRGPRQYESGGGGSGNNGGGHYRGGGNGGRGGRGYGNGGSNNGGRRIDSRNDRSSQPRSSSQQSSAPNTPGNAGGTGNAGTGGATVATSIIIHSVEAPATIDPIPESGVSEPKEPTVESTPEFKSDHPGTSTREGEGIIVKEEQSPKTDTRSTKRRKKKSVANGREQTTPGQDGIDGYEECKGHDKTVTDEGADGKEGWTVKKGKKGQDPLYSRDIFTTKPKIITVDANPYSVIQEEDEGEDEGDGDGDQGNGDHGVGAMAPGESIEASYPPLQEREGIGTMDDYQHNDKSIKNDLKIMAFNINSVRRRAQHAMEILRAEQPDILFLQETKVSDEEFPQALIDFATGLGYQVYFRGQKQQLGVALFTKHTPQRITFEIDGASSVTAFRYMETTIMGLTIIGIYAPQGQQFSSIHYRRKREFYDALYQRVRALQDNGHVVMIMGDFNIIPADEDMHNPGHPYHDTNASASEEERGWLDRFIEKGFIDLFAHHYTHEQRRQGRTYTWWGDRSAYKRNKGWRIDHFYVPSSHLQSFSKPMTLHDAVNYQMTNPKGQPVKPSDHVPIWTRVSLDGIQRTQKRPGPTTEWESVTRKSRSDEDSVKAIRVHKAICEVPRESTPRFKISNSFLIFMDVLVSSPSGEPSVNMTNGGNIRIIPARHPDHPEHNGSETYRITAQLDSGAAVTLCSPELAKSVDAWIFDHDVQLMGFNGSTTTATQYAIFSVHVPVQWMPTHKLLDRIGESGIDSDPDDEDGTRNEEQVYSCIVHALIHPCAPFELLLAGDFIHEHDVVTYAGRGCTTIGRGDRRRVAEHVPWSHVEAEIAWKRRLVGNEPNTVYLCGPLPEDISKFEDQREDEPAHIHGNYSSTEADLCQSVKRELELFRSDVADMIKNEKESKEHGYVVAFQVHDVTVHEVTVDRPAGIFSLDKVRTGKQRRRRSLQCTALDPVRLNIPCVACGSELHCLDSCELITINGLVSIPYLASLHPTECRRTLESIRSLHGLKPESVRHVKHTIDQERHQHPRAPILTVQTWNGLDTINPPQPSLCTDNHEELISMARLDSLQNITHEWNTDEAYGYPLLFLKDTASRIGEDILHKTLMLAWHHGIHNLWTTLACAVLSKTCIDGVDITPDQPDWKYFMGTVIRELRGEILQALSKSVADLDPEQIEEFLHQCRFGDHVGEDNYPAKFIEYKKASQIPYYVHLARMIADNGVGAPLLINTTEVAETVQRLTTEQQSDMEQSITMLREFRATRCRDMMDELRPKLFPPDLWALLPDDQKKNASERWALYKDKRIMELIEEKLDKVDISRETPSREMEYPFVRAQVYANIDVWGRPDKREIIRIKGAEMEIRLKEDTKPIRVKPRHLAPLERANLRCRMQKMLSQDMIESKSKSEWSSAFRLVAIMDKLNKFFADHGDYAYDRLNDPTRNDEIAALYRFTSDFRYLNSCTIPELFPLPKIADLINECAGGDRYSGTDIEDAFFMVRLAESSQACTAFLTPDDHYHYKVAPQGARCSAVIFARIISERFTHLLHQKKVIVYQDDVLNHDCASFSSHYDSQQNIYDVARDNTFLFKAAKTHLNYRKQKVLGHIVSKQGRTVDPGLVRDIIALKPPHDLQGVQQLLGMVQQAREYIHELTHIVEPIQRLVRKDIDIPSNWGIQQDNAFELLKQKLTSAPYLLQPDLQKQFRIHVDACRKGRGIGAVLLQQDENDNWKPVAYYSRVLKTPERKLAATELEATALHDAILHWKCYLNNGRTFQVISDHYALVYMVTKPAGDPHQRLHRLCTDLQGYSFEIIHRKGEEHLDADAVSRLLQFGDDIYVNNADDLRDDFGPLSPLDEELLQYEHPADYKKVIEITNRHRLERREEMARMEAADARAIAEKILKRRAVPVDDGDRIDTAIKRLAGKTKNTLVANGSLNPGASSEDNLEVTEEASNSISFLNLSEETQRKLRGDDESPFEDQSVIINTQQELRRSARLAEQSHRRTAEALKVAEQKEREEIIQLKIAESIRNQVDTGQSTVDDTGKEYLSSRARRKLEKQTKKQLISEIVWQNMENYGYLVGMDYEEDDGQLYTVINTFFDAKKQYWATSKPQKESWDVPLGNPELKRRLIVGDDSVAYRVERLLKGMKQGSITRWPRTEEEWIQEQLNDAGIAPIVSLLDQPDAIIKISGDKEATGDYLQRPVMDDGKTGALRRYRTGQAINFRVDNKLGHITATVAQLVVPKSIRPNLLFLMHEGMGHTGRNRTLSNIRSKYYWPNQAADVADHVKKCHFCQQRKAYLRRSAIPIQKYPFMDRPMTRVHVDLTGPLVSTKQGNLYILVMKCALTKWIELVAIPDKKASTVASHMVTHLFHRHGVPRQLVSDNGSEFDNGLLQMVCDIMALEHRVFITPRNPRSDGAVEKQMSTLKDEIASYVKNTTMDTWDEFLSVAAFHYNTTVNEATSFTPFFMIHGREASTPEDAHLCQLVENYSSVNAYIEQMRKALIAVWTSVGVKSRVDVEEWNRKAQNKIEYKPYAVGDLFYLATIPKRQLILQTLGGTTAGTKKNKDNIRKLSSKLQMRYVGPYRIIKVINPILFVADIHNVERVVTAVNMKPY